MICPKCGTVVGDSYKECPICGWELVPEEPEYVDADAQLVDEDESENETARKPASKGKIIGILAAAAVVVICAALLVPNLLHIGYKSVVSDYFKAIKSNDYALMMSLYPAQVSQIGGANKDEYVKNAVDGASQSYVDEYGEDYGYSYKITGVKKISAPQELSNVAEAVELSVQLTLAGNSKKDKSQVALTVIKQSGKWYLFNYS